MAHPNSALWNIQPNDVLFEDDVIIVINKPDGIPSQATLDPHRDHCYAAVGRYLEKKAGHPCYVGLHHRLDVMTSGALLLTKSQSVNASISEQFQSHTIQKSYIAIAQAPSGQTIDTNLSGDWLNAATPLLLDAAIGEIKGSKPQKFCVGGKNRKPAQTEIFCLSHASLRDGQVFVCKCLPHTGRTHQIRVHLAHLGISIIGDPLYGLPLLRSLRSISPQRMCLHAESITFDHPVTGKRLTISAPLPKALEVFIRKLGL